MSSKNKSVGVDVAESPFETEYVRQLNPKKNYYDFYINEMVGYVPAAFFIGEKNKEEISVVKDFGNAAALLLIQAFQEFQALDINIIESDLDFDFPNFNKIITKKGYKLLDNEKMVARLPVERVIKPYKKKIKDKHIRDFKIRENKDNEILIPELVEFLLLHENIAEKSLNTFFTYLYTTENILLSQLTVACHNKIVGHGLLVKTRWDSKTALLSFLHAQGKQSELIEHLLISRLLEAASENNIRSIEVHLRDDVYDLSENYMKFGFKFKPVSTFSKI